MRNFIIKSVISIVLGAIVLSLTLSVHFSDDAVFLLTGLALSLPWLDWDELDDAKMESKRIKRSIGVGLQGPIPADIQNTYESKLAVDDAMHEIKPHYAFSETIFQTATDELFSDASANLLRECVNRELKGTHSKTSKVMRIKGQSNKLCLADAAGQFYIWADFANESNRMRIQIFYGEKNRGLWRSKQNTNWHIDRARQTEAELYQNFQIMAVLAVNPKLSDHMADKSQELRQSFMISLSSGFERWNTERSNVVSKSSQASSDAGYEQMNVKERSLGVTRTRRD